MKRAIVILLILCLLFSFGTSVGEEEQPMKQGDKGEEVVRVQTRLFDLGFYTYKPTGSFQTVTRSAVVAYQVASGIMSDGSIGAETMQLLFDRNAKRVEFHAQIPLTFTAQGAITQKGSAVSWNEIKPKLVPGEKYRVINAATGEDVTLVFDSGESHAEFRLPVYAYERSPVVRMLNKWLGETNSFYKCAVLLELDGQRIAASMQWNGESRVCVYFRDSLSHVLGFTDIEHEMNIKKAAY
jgi:hypothetical protein